MEMKLNIYKAKGKFGVLTNEVERTAIANDFELSTGVCDDVLHIVNIDLWEGGLAALSDESKQELMLGIVKDGYPFFVGLVQEIFEITDDEAKRLKLADVAKVVFDIVRYSFKQLVSSFGGSLEKN